MKGPRSKSSSPKKRGWSEGFALLASLRWNIRTPQNLVLEFAFGHAPIGPVGERYHQAVVNQGRPDKHLPEEVVHRPIIHLPTVVQYGKHTDTSDRFEQDMCMLCVESSVVALDGEQQLPCSIRAAEEQQRLVFHWAAW